MRFLQNALQDLIDGLEVASDRAGLEQAARRTACRLGFRWFAYLGSVEEEVTIISSYPVAWVRHYREQQFERVDPVIGRSRSSGHSSGVISTTGRPAINGVSSLKQAVSGCDAGSPYHTYKSAERRAREDQLAWKIASIASDNVPVDADVVEMIGNSVFHDCRITLGSP